MLMRKNGSVLNKRKLTVRVLPDLLAAQRPVVLAAPEESSFLPPLPLRRRLSDSMAQSVSTLLDSSKTLGKLPMRCFSISLP